MQSLLDPAILFFALGVFAGLVRSNLEMPAAISKFLSIYLLMALGLKGGFALAASGFTPSVATSLGLAVLPCFVGDLDPRLGRIASPIAELETEQWLVTHHEERHRPEVRRVVERIAAVIKAHAPLFRGERREAWRNEVSTSAP